MSCAARYSETTSLEFILNPFKFFFHELRCENRAVCASRHSSLGNTDSLTYNFALASPLLRNDCRPTSLPLHCHCALTAPPFAVLFSTDRHAPLHESSRSSNNPTVTPDSLSARARFVASSADVMRFPVPRYLFHQRTASSFGLHRPALCYMFVHRAGLEALLTGGSSSGSSTRERFCSTPFNISHDRPLCVTAPACPSY
jgi:hypothetical protein